MDTVQVKLTRLEIELMHRLFSAKILAAPPGVEDGLRRKMARARKKLKEQTAETIEHGRRDDDDSDRVPTSPVSPDQGGMGRAESDTSKPGQCEDCQVVDQAPV